MFKEFNVKRIKNILPLAFDRGKMCIVGNYISMHDEYVGRLYWHWVKMEE
jgi:hypothetical protein